MKKFRVEAAGTALQEPHPCAAGSRTQPGTTTAMGTSWRAAPSWGSLLSSSFHGSGAPLQKGNNICFIYSSLRKPWGLDPRHPETQNILPLQIPWFKRGARDREESKIPSSSLKNRKSGLPCAVPSVSCREGRN